MIVAATMLIDTLLNLLMTLLEGDEQLHRPVVNDSVSWCDESFLQLNVSKTKDVIISFRKSSPCPVLTSIKGTNIADDSVIVSLLEGDEQLHGPVVNVLI